MSLFLPMEEAVREVELNYVWNLEDAQRAYVQSVEGLSRDHAHELASFLGHDWSQVMQRFPMSPGRMNK
jgi:hypothetical protein